MMTRNKENKGKMPRVTLDIMLNPTKIDEFGSWSRRSWRATRHGQEVSIATNSRQPPPKALNIHTEQPGWWNTYHTQHLQKGRWGKMLGILQAKWPIWYKSTTSKHGEAMLNWNCHDINYIFEAVLTFNPWYICTIYCYLPTEKLT